MDERDVVVSGSETLALREAFEDLFAVEEVEVQIAADRVARAITVPEGVELKSLKPLMDEFRLVPERIRGVATIGDLDSFLAHVLRFQDAGSAIFAYADPKTPALVAVYDYSQPRAPRFGEHRAKYTCPLSDEWRAWAAHDSQFLSAADFAVFLEDRIGDVIVADSAGEDSSLTDFARLWDGSFATPQRLVELSRGLALKAEHRVKQALNLSSGEATIQFEEAHADEHGAPLRVPNFFLIAIPVFRSGEAYRIPVRLRYRVRDGKIFWSYSLHRADKVFDHAFDEVVQQARTTNIPVFVGTPEA